MLNYDRIHLDLPGLRSCSDGQTLSSSEQKGQNVDNSLVIEETRSAYHLNGIFGNSGENSNGTVHPGGLFSKKR